MRKKWKEIHREIPRHETLGEREKEDKKTRSDN